jgi:glucose/arabinose dehydrogenase
VPGVFPPLAKSDSLTNDISRSIRAVCEGLNGEIAVNGRKYNGAMPATILDDEGVAAVFTYALNSWGNPGGEVTVEQVREVRAKTRYPTYEKLKSSSDYPPLPPAPAGFTVREVLRLSEKGVRLASDGKGEFLYMLTEGGNVWRIEIANGSLRQILQGNDYLERRAGDLGGPLFVLALAVDKENRIYIGSNQQNGASKPPQNIVTIYRSNGLKDGDPANLKPWFQTNYPGSPAYIHALEHIAFGPDGFLYAGNGARTDGGLTSNDPNWYGGGETPITACIWRIDPKVENPPLEVYARGIRNAYGFCWNDRGEMFATENGPDAHAPEEINHIEQGKHYGFPFAYANWTKKAYSRSPDAPPDLKMTLPIANLGPDGGFEGEPIYSLDPHSGPGGIVYLGDDFPEEFRGNLLFNRFGNFIRQPKENSGFDILRAKLSRNAAGVYESHVYTVLTPLGRPIDVHLSGKGKIYILEHSRGTNSGMSYGLPGRILELSVKK